MRFCVNGDFVPHGKESDGEKNQSDDAPIEAWERGRDSATQLLKAARNSVGEGVGRFRRLLLHGAPGG
jgi:hypothetical protein